MDPEVNKDLQEQYYLLEEEEKNEARKKTILIVSLNNFDFTTTFSGVLTTINNVGPGFEKVGPIENFSAFSSLSKIVFCLDMLIGRLEIFPFLVLFSPNLWRKKF